MFADFEGGDYGDWKVAGEAFGNAPASGGRTIEVSSGFLGRGLVNSWTGSDKLQGKLISPDFEIEKPFINFLIAGGRDEKSLNISLWVSGKKVRSAAGKQSDAMAWASWDVAGLVGEQAHIEILDASSRGWGHTRGRGLFGRNVRLFGRLRGCIVHDRPRQLTIVVVVEALVPGVSAVERMIHDSRSVAPFISINFGGALV